MANCPKCGRHLKLSDWKQHCPDCGANIFVYNQQERLMQEADIAEVQYYHFQKKVDRVKASFIGSKLAIARIFTSLLPLGGLFLPLIKAKVSEPFEPMDGGISAMTLYNSIDKLTGDAIPTLLGNALTKTPTLIMLASLGLLLLSVLTMVVHFILLTLSCSPKGKLRNTVVDAIMLATAFGSVIAAAAIPDGGALSGVKIGIGAILFIILQLVNAGLDLFIVYKKPIEVVHKQCYVGAIPIEEYFEMQEKGMSTAQIRVIQYERLKERQKEKEAKFLAEQAALEEKEKKAKEASSNV